jgi:hypothetical protein
VAGVSLNSFKSPTNFPIYKYGKLAIDPLNYVNLKSHAN